MTINKTWYIVGILLLFYLFRRKIISASYSWPHSGQITSPFGMRVHPITGELKMHKGIDIDGVTGDDVRAAQSGVVILSGNYGTAGNIIKIRHQDGNVTSYMHLDSRKVSENDNVFQGDVIGSLGATGAVTGSHLHFSVETPDGYIDPLSILV
jgi:YD repeat-containing protein